MSHHYAPAEKFARPSETLTGRLAQALTVDGTAPRSGLTWTIDTPYRETVAEARSYQAEGVVCVEWKQPRFSPSAVTAAWMWLPPS